MCSQNLRYLLIALVSLPPLTAQVTEHFPPPVTFTAEQDHQQHDGATRHKNTTARPER